MTYSVVARDPDTGELGVAVQSHWFATGAVVTAAEAGVGAIATQANVEVQYKARALDLLRDGVRAPAVIEALVAVDPLADHRQVAVVDRDGGVGVWTGSSAFAAAGHVAGDGWSVQANMMRSDAVWPAMAEALASTTGDLTTRLLATLDAAEAAGGDLRGRQSAAILVVPADGTPADRVVDLRVDDSPDPLRELRRLVAVHDAYVLAERGDVLLGRGDHAGAAAAYLRASELQPENHELRFWAGLELIGTADEGRGLGLLRQTITSAPQWRTMLTRLADVAPASVRALQLLDG